MSISRPDRNRNGRPILINFVAILIMVLSIFPALYFVGVSYQNNPVYNITYQEQNDLFYNIIFLVSVFIILLVTFVISSGFIKGKIWAWYSTIILSGVLMTAMILSIVWIETSGFLFWFAIILIFGYGLLIYFLSIRKVKEYFRNLRY